MQERGKKLLADQVCRPCSRTVPTAVNHLLLFFVYRSGFKSRSGWRNIKESMLSEHLPRYIHCNIQTRHVLCFHLFLQKVFDRSSDNVVGQLSIDNCHGFLSI
jgi:hypothetical protein